MNTHSVTEKNAVGSHFGIIDVTISIFFVKSVYKERHQNSFHTQSWTMWQNIGVGGGKIS